ncbi:hypothetical protein EMIHUDRAFT_215778 [Emiliania huxleyi CCMP1516]|uniref:Uncharacterized protein n=2 Tax=Emiliania huxleyi TaxID=2903 RepID=A0A0D3IGX4_EMIH1|nr:hypothetical protein EMIHUDRAFT_218123 [Emiliania huxleyi CCMP1516]XP_005762938.1 hypothetical protein EMIHUDRAFT_215778 [Emiliania huxleyi CCMP1516]EOD07639.1 hypothetical protein EMIHUDRAFT_218123 [Emiliania huxleyi CCMP1516]EOD10509.1 hypothetical protein EMIHUDRAFT_215778 [Emiliania huxleyi CCMP1516]|eukprot:XP_005760068.1 hypothetical protein EMIHUDRAFT_218123 [Emiliania huxleyi CCMP1516]
MGSSRRTDGGELLRATSPRHTDTESSLAPEASREAPLGRVSVQPPPETGAADASSRRSVSNGTTIELSIRADSVTTLSPLGRKGSVRLRGPFAS